MLKKKKPPFRVENHGVSFEEVKKVSWKVEMPGEVAAVLQNMLMNASQIPGFIPQLAEETNHVAVQKTITFIGENSLILLGKIGEDDKPQPTLVKTKDL